MGQITRPTKAGGTTTYTSEVLAVPNKKIIAKEVDDDLNLLYSTIDNLDTGNLNPTAANITGHQLASNADILGSQLSATAGILGTQLAAGANILGSQLSPTAGIVAGQLVSGIGVRQTAQADVAGFSTGTTEVSIGGHLSLTTVAGTLVLIVGTVGGYFATTTGNGDILFKLYDLANPSTPFFLTTVRLGGFNQGVSNPSPVNIPCTLPILTFRTSTAALHNFQLNVVTTTAAIQWTTVGASSGTLYAVEFA